MEVRAARRCCKVSLAGREVRQTTQLNFEYNIIIIQITPKLFTIFIYADPVLWHGNSQPCIIMEIQ